MTVTNPDTAKFNEIAARFYREDESVFDNEARVERAGIEAGWWFDAVTKPQAKAYSEAISVWAGDYSPRANRARDAAKAAFYASTVEARALCLRAYEDFLRDGEVGEETADAFESLISPPVRGTLVAEPFRQILNAVGL